MIQASTPIQTQSASGAEPELLPVETRRGQKSRKSDKLGVFGKLLEGLIEKSRNKRAAKNNPAAANEAEETQLLPVLQKAKASTVKKENNALDKLDKLDTLNVLNGENSPQTAVVLGQHEPLTRQNSVSTSEVDLESAALTLEKPESPAAGPGETEKIFSFKDESSSQSPETDPVAQEKQALEGELLLAKDAAQVEEAASSLRPLSEENRQETKTAGSGRGAVDMLPVSARNQDEKLYQFTGAPRPALVDSFSHGPEETQGSRPAEGRKKGRERLNSGQGSLKPGELRESGVSEAAASPGIGGEEKIDLEIQADLRTEPARKDGGADYGKAGSSGNQGLEDSLVRELRENLGTDIVKQASILVRNQQEGTIRLTLKPETLGNIKIRLEMAENKITGHIVVESSEALKAFERELPVLEKAFRDSGFSEASLDMSMAGNGESYGREEEAGDFNKLSPVLAASRYDAGIVGREVIPQGFFPENSGQKAVNMLV